MKKEFSWKLLEGQGFQIVSYIIFLAVIIIFDLSFLLLALLITIFITVKIIFKKKGFVEWLKSMATITVLLSVYYAIAYFIGGLWSVLIIHVLGCSFIIYSHWGLIKKANKEIKSHARYVATKQRRYKEWKKQQSKTQ